MRLLVAEDDDGLRDVLVLGLAEQGYQVDAVARGDDAIDQLKWYEYDVAIIDWRMPGAPGIDVVAWARRHQRPTALLMLTARDAPHDRIEGLDAGADDYLVKPFDFGELLARVRALQRRPHAVDGPVLSRGRLALDPRTRVVTVAGDGPAPDRHRVPDPGAAAAASAGGRRSQGHRRARLGGRDRPPGLQRHRRPAQPVAGQADRRGHPHRHRARHRLSPRGSMRAARAARAEGVRGASIRVALLATALVAVVYLVIGAAVVLLVTHDLTQQIDDRLVASLSHIGDEPGGPPDSGYGAPPPDRFGPATLVWTIHANGTIQATNAEAVLPTVAYHATTPQTVMVGDVALRVAGGVAGDDYVVVGQTLDTVSQATSTILLAEVLIAPVLLIVVFLGAVAIGRRVAAPDRARPPAPARLHRRRLARAAHAALGHRGPRQPGGHAAAHGRLVRQGLPGRRP